MHPNSKARNARLCCAPGASVGESANAESEYGYAPTHISTADP